MNSKFSSCLSILNFPLVVKFLILLHVANGVLLPRDFYNSCNITYSCGNGSISGVGYPFRGTLDPAFCGHPGFVLECNPETNYTTIEIANSRYLVLTINQNAQMMSLVREDMARGSCPHLMVNTTLDFAMFNYTDSCINYTFLYGCPDSDHLSGIDTCPDDDSVYVVPGSHGPGNCDRSVIVPISSTGNQARVGQVLLSGFEVSWLMDSSPCQDCRESNGRCGYNYTTNQATCLCPNSPPVPYSCPADQNVSGTNTLCIIFLRMISLVFLRVL